MKIGNLVNHAKGFLNQYKSESPAAYAAAQQAIGGLLILDGFIGIDNPLGGKKRPGIFGSIAGMVVGVVFLFVPMLFGNLTGVTKMTAKTNATIVSISQHQSTTTSNGSQQTSTTCSAIAKYTVNGKEYTRQSSFSSSSLCGFTSGETAQINYNPNNPSQWSNDVKLIGIFLKVFFFAGIFTIISSLFIFAIRLLSIIFGWKLLKSGRSLAKTLPQGTDLTTAVKEIEQRFKTSLFGFGAGGLATPTQVTSIPETQDPNASPDNSQPPQ